jgi:hypothetical protein
LLAAIIFATVASEEAREIAPRKTPTAGTVFARFSVLIVGFQKKLRSQWMTYFL